MVPQQNPPPGGYPDPAKPPTRSRRQMGVIVAVAAVFIVAVCVIAPVVFVGSMLGPSLGELTDAADGLKFPPELTLVHETSTGNRMCLDECVHLSRFYTSPFPGEATIKIVVTALEKAGYRCVIPPLTTVNRDWCGNFEVNVLSYWKRGTDSFTLSFDVHPIPGTWASTDLSGVPVDPASQSYVGVYL